jgi:predicted DNA-binding antitoxin AbrB/MazE fold protein
MSKAVEGIYEHGVIRPLTRLDLPEHQRVRLTVELLAEATPKEILEAAAAGYANLSPREIAEVEAIALDRAHFFRERP